MTDIIGNVARGWNRNPDGQLHGQHPGGISAALWTHDEDDVQELAADPDHATHLLALRLSRYEANLKFNGRSVYEGPTRPGSASLLCAGDTPHSVNRGPWRVLHLYLPKSVSDGILADEQLSRLVFGAGLTSDGNIVDPVIERYGREILAELEAGLPLARLRIDCLGQDLMIQLIRRQRLDGADAPLGGRQPVVGSDWRLRRAIDMLEDRMAEDLSVADLARASGLSAVHLTSLFRKATGLPPHQWLLRRRVERARALIGETQDSITDVALRCGFSSSQHLATVFRRFLGVTPTEYRRSTRL